MKKRATAFENPAIRPSKLEIHRHIKKIRFECPAFLFPFKSRGRRFLIRKRFENPVIFSASQTFLAVTCSHEVFEYHVAFSSPKRVDR